jgi:hypothetical protein
LSSTRFGKSLGFFPKIFLAVIRGSQACKERFDTCIFRTTASFHSSGVHRGTSGSQQRQQRRSLIAQYEMRRVWTPGGGGPQSIRKLLAANQAFSSGSNSSSFCFISADLRSYTARNSSSSSSRSSIVVVYSTSSLA